MFGNWLTDMTAIYGSGVSLGDSGQCSHSYSLIVNSNESCVTCGDQHYTFPIPQPFGTSFWVPPSTMSRAMFC